MSKKNIIIYTHTGKCYLNNGGSVVEYYLGQILDELGQTVRIYPNNGVKANNIIFNKFYENDFPIDNNAVVIYCEGTVGNPLNAKNIVRWMLSPLGTNVPYERLYSWNKNEIVYYFNSEIKFKQYPEKVGSIYKLLSALYIYPNIKQTNFGIRKGTCFTYRKIHFHKNGIKNLHSPSAFELTDNNTQDTLIQKFNQYKFFISYDPLTFISIIAALCGCISIVYPVNGLSKLDWINTTAASEYIKFKGLDNLYGIAYGLEDIKYAEETISLAKEQWTDIQKFCIEQTVIPFINDIQNMENLVNTIENNYY